MKVTTAEALEILDLEETADEIQIRKAYRRLAMKWHPDKNPDSEVEAKQQFQRIHAAYTKLQGEESDEEGEDEDEDGDFFNFFDDEDDLSAMFFEFMMHKMYGGNDPNIRVHSFNRPAYAQQRPSGSRGPPPSQQRRAPMGRPSTMERSMFYADEDDDEDEGDADFYFDRNEEREFLRQEQAKRDARARQARAQAAARAARQNAEADAKAERARGAEQTARAAAEEAEALRRLCSQLPRPIMIARTETSITLSLARLMKSSGEDKLPKQCVWELEMREHPGGTWYTIHPVRDSLTVVADRLTAGTKYIFRAHAARKCPDGSLEWGKCSEESHYATAGKAPSAAAAAAAQSDASKRGKRREAAVKKEGKRQQPQGSSRLQESDEEEEQQRLQAEKAKAAAIKAAQERAAQDYEREVQQLNELKLASEARINEKVRKAKQKARKKEEYLANADEAEKVKPAVNNRPESSPPRRELPPRAPHYRAAPTLRAYNETFADNFGNVQRTSSVGAGPLPATAHSRAAPVPSLAAYGDEMSDAEMAQLVAVLEESERTAREEAEARKAMHMSDMAYPSLSTGTSPAKHQTHNEAHSEPRAAGFAPDGTSHTRQPKSVVPPAQKGHHRQPAQPMQNGAPPPLRKISSSYQPSSHETPAAVQSGSPPPQRQRSFTAPAAQPPPKQQTQPPKRVPHQQPSAEWELPPQAQPLQTDWELPPEAQSVAYVPPEQCPADFDWELPPEQHDRQPVKKISFPQKISIPSLLPIGMKRTPDVGAALSGPGHALVWRNGVPHSEHVFGMQQSGTAPVPKPMPVPAPKKVAPPPLRKVYNPNGAPLSAPAQQAPVAGTGTSQPLPDLLQLLMPKAGA